MSNAAARPIPRLRGLTFPRQRLSSLLVFVVILSLLALFFVWTRLQVVHLGYEIASLQSRIHQLGQEGQRLRLEAASLNSLARIERIAVRELGLKRPAPEQVIMVRE